MMRRGYFTAAFGILCAAILVFGLSGFVEAQTAQTDQESDSACTSGRSFLCVPKLPDISGTYTGTLTDAVSGNGTITLSLEQKERHLTGLWSVTYANGQGNSGSLTGTVSKSAVRAKLLTRIPDCFYHALVTISSNGFQGTFVDSARCPEEDSGSFTIPRNH